MELSLSDFLYHVKDNHNDLKLRVNAEFMGHCMKNIDQTLSQNFQDQFALYVKEKINPHTRGFFVEFGAAKPTPPMPIWRTPPVLALNSPKPMRE